MDAGQWVTIGVSIANLLALPKMLSFVLSIERRLTRIEAKLGIND
ncbi:hypothetical protein [Burkholderia ubonensis]|nr:hypothetical protein [Burkholderia ubonensis]